MSEWICHACEHTFTALIENGRVPECPKCANDDTLPPPAEGHRHVQSYLWIWRRVEAVAHLLGMGMRTFEIDDETVSVTWKKYLGGGDYTTCQGTFPTRYLWRPDAVIQREKVIEETEKARRIAAAEGERKIEAAKKAVAEAEARVARAQADAEAAAAEAAAELKRLLAEREAES